MAHTGGSVVGDGRFIEMSQRWWCLPNVPFLFHSQWSSLKGKPLFVFPFSTFHPFLKPLWYSFHTCHSVILNAQLQCGPQWPTCCQVQWTVLSSSPTHGLTCDQHCCYKLLPETLYFPGYHNIILFSDHFLPLTSWSRSNLPRFPLLCFPPLK